jgi:imidazolonepropionase-like amidohydrolase
MSKYIFLLLVVFYFNQSYAQLLIKNTNVVDVEKKKILSGYDVLVRDGKIFSIEKSQKNKSKQRVKVIDGSGKWLIPGFADAHVHFFQSGGLFTRPDVIDLRKYQPYAKEIKWVHEHMEDFLRLYTSAGITSVIDVGSTFNFLQQRDSFSKKFYAPIISMTGPLLTTYVPSAFKDLGTDSPFILMTTEEETRKGVRSELAYKPDFIKIWYIVQDTNTERGARKNLSLVKAVIDEAHKNNLRVAVHATQRITAQLAVEAGADFLVHDIDDEVVSNEFLQLLKSKNIVLCPTLIVADNYSKVLGNNYQFKNDEKKLTHPVPASSITNYPKPDTAIASRYINRIAYPAMKSRRKKADSINVINLKRMLDAGITIATGTDAGNIGTQHVSSYFIELKAMQQAGFNNWQLLQSSTINAAKAVGKQDEWGSIEKGKIANMVLLNANPLSDLANWRKIDYVISKGVAIKPDSLLQFMKSAAEK